MIIRQGRKRIRLRYAASLSTGFALIPTLRPGIQYSIAQTRREKLCRSRDVEKEGQIVFIYALNAKPKEPPASRAMPVIECAAIEK